MVATRSILLLTVALLSLTGCRICTNCEDDAYPTYGGIWQRTDRFNGRVGSLFEPAGAKIAQPQSEFSDQPSEVEPTEEDTTAGDEDEFEALPPGQRRPEEYRSPGEDEPLEEAAPNGSGDAETEEVRLQQPFGNPGNFTDF